MFLIWTYQFWVFFICCCLEVTCFYLKNKLNFGNDMFVLKRKREFPGNVHPIYVFPVVDYDKDDPENLAVLMGEADDAENLAVLMGKADDENLAVRAEKPSSAKHKRGQVLADKAAAKHNNVRVLARKATDAKHNKVQVLVGKADTAKHNRVQVLADKADDAKHNTVQVLADKAHDAKHNKVPVLADKADHAKHNKVQVLTDKADHAKHNKVPVLPRKGDSLLAAALHSAETPLPPGVQDVKFLAVAAAAAEKTPTAGKQKPAACSKKFAEDNGCSVAYFQTPTWDKVKHTVATRKSYLQYYDHDMVKWVCLFSCTHPQHKLYSDFMADQVAAPGAHLDRLKDIGKMLKNGEIKVDSEWRDRGIIFGGESGDSRRSDVSDIGDDDENVEE